jgi:hypothetical protein
MNSAIDTLLLTIRTYVQGLPKPLFDDVLKIVTSELESLASEGILQLGDDERLTGPALEIRTRQILQEMGLNIHQGRQGFEDFVVYPPTGASIDHPIVLEIKSSRQPQIKREDLRQLDDWVYDLSQEEQARKYGLGGGLDPMAVLTHGMRTRKQHHPSPHKGVMIFNGPIGSPFALRVGSCLSQNDVEFVTKRNFCVIPLQHLIKYAELFQQSNFDSPRFWEKLHSTCGVLLLPEETCT